MRPSLRQRFWALTIPNILANLMVPLAGLVDTAMLGHLTNMDYLGGVGLAGLIFDYLYWTFGFLRMGTTGLTAQAFGRNREGETRRIPLRAAIIALTIASIILLFKPWIAELSFGILDGSETVKDQARLYFDARLWGAPAVMLNFVLLGWFLGIQRSDRVLVMSLVGNGANILLDYIFIFRLDMASAGAGWATMCSQLLMLLVGVSMIPACLSKSRKAMQGAREERSDDPEEEHFALFDRRRIRDLLSLSRDIMIRTFALISSFALFTNFSAAISTQLLAANTVLLKILSLASYFIDGYAFATESLAGLLFGRNQREELIRLLKMALVMALITAALFASSFIIFPLLFTLITDNPLILESIDQQRLWLLPVLAFGAIAYILDGYFIGLARGRILAGAMVFSFLLGFLPLALYAHYFALGDAPFWLWLSMTLFMIARVISLGVMLPRSLRMESSSSPAAMDSIP